MSGKIIVTHQSKLASAPDGAIRLGDFVLILDKRIAAKEENIHSREKSAKILILSGSGWILLVALAWMFAGKGDLNFNQIMTTGIGLVPLAASLMPYKDIGPERERLAAFRGMKMILETESISPESDARVVDLLFDVLPSYLSEK
ncbi:MAG TPA: hypothetical protein VGO56_15500 [Pyrinomonadaceae bacterium]|jgi:hypothetical protein|nr:hypothetical protein [Pyrinomonadaceae bacterium]